MNLRRFLNFTLLLAAFANIQTATAWNDYEIVKIENSSKGVFRTKFTSKRYDESTFELSGPVEFAADFNDDWQLELRLLFSAKGDDKFVKLPYSVPKNDLCKIVNGFIFKSGVAKDVSDGSDVPAPVNNKPLCTLYQKGHYTIHRLLLKKSVIPKLLQKGYYKAQAIFNKKNSDEISNFVLHFKLY